MFAVGLQDIQTELFKREFELVAHFLESLVFV
jgi:hypothetical protein